MITFNNIVERFEIFAENHFFIKTFSFGSPDDVDLSKFTSFPLMHLVYTGATYDAGTKTYNLEVYILDAPADKDAKTIRQKEVVSDAEQCAEDIIADIKNGGNIFLFAQDYEVVNATTTPLEEETKNVLSGVLLDLSVSIPYEWDACNAPIDGVTPEGGDEVSYARRGILRMVTQNGATDVLSVRTIKVTNGTLTDEGDGVVSLDTAGAESLDELTDVYLVNLANNQILKYQAFSLPGSPAGWKNQDLDLSALSDTKGTPVEGHLLKYTGGFWQPSTIDLNTLNGVTVTNPITGNVLQYSSTLGWYNTNLPTPSPPPSTTDQLPEGTTNLYYTEARVSANADVAANTAKNTYPSADAAKLAGIEEGAEVNVNADWNATSGDAEILNKPTIPTNTNVANTDLTLIGNKTFDHDGGTLTFDLNDGGEFIIQDSSLGAGTADNISMGSGAVSIFGILYPTADGTAGQAIVTDGNGQLSFADIAVDVQYHNRYQSESETLRAGGAETIELYYSAQADGDGYAESAESDTATAGYDIRRKLYYSEAAQADPDTGTWVQFADIADDTTFASAKATLLAYLKERTGGTVPISLKMTWEEVAESSLLLDTYTGAAAAYSLRQLRTAYTGDAIRVRRASDNAEQDIGFDGSGGLDTTSLALFCLGTDGFVKTWYDQSGNANDATQTTAANQPKIYDSVTGVVTENGKPALEFDGSNDGYLLDTSSLDIGSLSSFTIGSFGDVSGSEVMLGLSGSIGSKRWYAPFLANGNFNFGYGASSTVINATADTAQHLHTMIAGTTLNGVEAFVDTLSVGTTTRTTGIDSTQNGIGNFNSAFYANCNVQEVIFYASDKSTDRTNIESNINTFYSIY